MLIYLILVLESVFCKDGGMEDGRASSDFRRIYNSFKVVMGSHVIYMVF